MWYRGRGPLASALSPLGAIYGRMAERKIAGAAPYRSRLPVICIGNFTAGGGGKTPTAIAVAEVLKGAGERPCFLTRGYGGKEHGPVLVAKGRSAAEVGDETLLLAAHAPTVVSADRAAGARLIEGTDATVIVMDDGFQNPQLAKDFSLIAVDAATGLGNGLVMPAGPLRAPLDQQMKRADALLLIGDGGKAAPLAKSFESANKPVLKARMTPRGDSRWLGVLPVIGFAGIANPKDFRNEVVKFALRHRAANDGKNPAWTGYEKIRNVIEKRMFSQVEDLLPVISFESKKDSDTQSKHNEFVKRMLARHYTARQVRRLVEWYMRVNKAG